MGKSEAEPKASDRLVLLYRDKGAPDWDLCYICEKLSHASELADGIEGQQAAAREPGECIIVLESDYDNNKLTRVRRSKREAETV